VASQEGVISLKLVYVHSSVEIVNKGYNFKNTNLNNRIHIYPVRSAGCKHNTLSSVFS
jgi:hypothetical protein